MSKTYICTGAAGFIGSHLVEKLLSAGHKVIGLDNFETGLRDNMQTFINNDNFKFYEKDISELDDINDLIALFGYQNIKIDGVFHTAAKARIMPSIIEPGRTFACNVVGTFNVLEMCRALKINRIIYSASSSAYGLTDKLPNVPGDKEICLNPYSASKLMGEKLCSTWANCYGINTIALRYFNVYGARSQLKGPYSPVIGIFFRQLLSEKIPMTIVGDGGQSRDFTYVSDVVRANVLAMEKCDRFSGRVFNVGCGVSYTINEIAEMIGGKTINIAPRPGEARATLASIKDTSECLGWTPEVDLREGVEIMREHYEKLFVKHSEHAKRD